MKNVRKGFIIPLLIAIIAVLAIGGGVYVFERGKLQQPVPIKKENKTMKENNNFSKYSTDFINLIPVNVKIGEERSFTQTPGLKIKLVNVLSDSRCPSGFECAIAGEAKALVEASYNGIVEKKEVTIQGERPYSSSGNTISIDRFKIFLVELNPHPIVSEEIKKTDYEGVFLADTVASLDFKKEIVNVAADELKKHFADYQNYFALGMTAEVGDASQVYTLTFGTPFASPDKKVEIEVKYLNEKLEVTKFTEL